MMVFTLISAFIFIVIAYTMKKRISYLEMYTTSLFAIVFQLLVDTILEFKYDLYGYFEKGVDYQTFIFIFLIYPPLNIIFLNYYPLNKKYYSKLMYIGGWVVFAIIYEYFAVESGAFYYNNWYLGYSLLAYPFVYLLIIANYLFIRRLLAYFHVNS